MRVLLGCLFDFVFCLGCAWVIKALGFYQNMTLGEATVVVLLGSMVFWVNYFFYKLKDRRII